MFLRIFKYVFLGRYFYKVKKDFDEEGDIITNLYLGDVFSI